MNGSRLFLDTNIIVYFLSGDKTLADLLDDKTVYLSFITELELLGYSALSARELTRTEQFLTQCTITDIHAEIKAEVIRIRRKYKLKLPDSIILASAQYLDIPLITSDNAFNKVTESSILTTRSSKSLAAARAPAIPT